MKKRKKSVQPGGRCVINVAGKIKSAVCSKQRPVRKKSRGCLSKSNINVVYQDQDSDKDDYCLMVESVDSVYQEESPKKVFATMVLEDKSVKFQLDSGATVNILPVEIYKEVRKDSELKHLKNSGTTLVMFNNSELRPLGTVKLQTRNTKNDESYLSKCTVVSQGLKALLGAQSIQQFSLVSVNVDNIMFTSVKAPEMPATLKDFADVFKGEGKLEEKLHLTLDKTVPPVILPVRKVSLALKEPLKKEIDRLVYQGILKPVDTPTDWVSSMVVVSKSNGKIRLCIDPKPLALRRKHYPLPVIDDFLPELSKAKVLSVVDAKNGFWHTQLDPESSFLTTFGTPWGRYRWTRMPFGISPAPKEFQRRLHTALGGLEGVVPIFDDILIFGVGETKEEAIENHDQRLKSLFERCRKKRH